MADHPQQAAEVTVPSPLFLGESGVGASGGASDSCPIPPFVRQVAEQCQELMFLTIGLVFVDVKFQQARTVAEAHKFMDSGVGDINKEGMTKKLHYLAWAHLQMLHAELAGLGYKHIISGVRSKHNLTQHPPVESWLTIVPPVSRKNRFRTIKRESSIAVPSASGKASPKRQGKITIDQEPIAYDIKAMDIEQASGTGSRQKKKQEVMDIIDLT